MTLSRQDPREGFRAVDFDEFVEFVARCLDEDSRTLSHSTRFVEDLCVSSIQMLEIAVALWDLIGIEITDGMEFVEAAKTIGTLHAYYCELLQRPLPEAGPSTRGSVPLRPARDKHAGALEGVPMAGARVLLRPVLPEDHLRLYALQTAEQVGFRWRYGGIVPPLEVFVREIHVGVHAQFVVSPLGRADVVGLVVAYQANSRSGTVYAGVAMAPRLIGSGIGIEALGLFLNYLFSTWSFRKVYFEALEFTYESVASAVPELIEVEGTLKEHHFYQGKYFDQYILSISREKFTRYFDEITMDAEAAATAEVVPAGAAFHAASPAEGTR